MPRSRDVTTQRAHLSAATWAVFAERGVTGLTLRAVAERAGCTTGLVLHAFPDKRALLRHARQLLFDGAAERSDRLEAEAASPVEALRGVLHASLDGDDESRVWLGFLAAALADDELLTSHVDGNRSFLDRVTRLLGAAQRDGGDGGDADAQAHADADADATPRPTPRARATPHARPTLRTQGAPPADVPSRTQAARAPTPPLRPPGWSRSSKA